MRYILNLPWTIIGIFIGIISVPVEISYNGRTIIFKVKKFWWALGYMKNMRAGTLGNVIWLGPILDAHDLDHELVHIQQFNKYPLIFPFLYYFQLIRYGYRNNKFEDEAYSKAKNHYGKIEAK